MRVRESFNLTGLGILLIGLETLPLLQAFELHTVWVVKLVFADGHEEPATASVEEISRPGEAGETTAVARALLLTPEGATTVPAGTQVYLLERAEL
ncbi:hypothetical protein [Hymenobacter fastidiosus]